MSTTDIADITNYIDDIYATNIQIEEINQADLDQAIATSIDYIDLQLTGADIEDIPTELLKKCIAYECVYLIDNKENLDEALNAAAAHRKSETVGNLSVTRTTGTFNINRFYHPLVLRWLNPYIISGLTLRRV